MSVGRIALKVAQIRVSDSFVLATRMLNRDLVSGASELAIIRRELGGLNEQVQHTPGEKWCCRCGETWVVSDDPKESGFSPDSRNRDGYRTHCKVCRNEMERKRYHAQKPQARVYRV